MGIVPFYRPLVCLETASLASFTEMVPGAELLPIDLSGTAGSAEDCSLAESAGCDENFLQSGAADCVDQCDPAGVCLVETCDPAGGAGCFETKLQ